MHRIGIYEGALHLRPRSCSADASHCFAVRLRYAPLRMTRAAAAFLYPRVPLPSCHPERRAKPEAEPTGRCTASGSTRGPTSAPEILLSSRLALLRSSTPLRSAQDDTGGRCFFCIPAYHSRHSQGAHSGRLPLEGELAPQATERGSYICARDPARPTPRTASQFDSATLRSG